jgi:hypothetical protein
MRKSFLSRVIAPAVLVSAGFAQHVELRSVPALQFPSQVDSNSPSFRSNGQLVIFNSTGMGPVRSTGATQNKLLDPHQVTAIGSTHRPYWIESTWVDQDGTVFAWYHHEPAGVCGSKPLTAPEIGALVSHDGGKSFLDLGIVLAAGYPVNCFSQNGYFAGGHGDFTVIPGQQGKFFYFLFSNYSGPAEMQGVAVARMPFDRRNSPFGAVQKYYNGSWQEPGVGGRVTPIFPATVAWEYANTDSFWGPSVHWNTFLNSFVMLLNHSCCSTGWPQEGVYISFNKTLLNPAGWSKPVKVIDGGGWYPQVVGYAAANGTDSRAGSTARFYMFGLSTLEMVFKK